MDRTCEVCGGAFKTSPTHVRAGNGRFCSRDCFNVEQRNRIGNQVERACETCGKRFMAKHTFVMQGKARFCSRECFNTGRRGPKKTGVKHRLARAKGHPLAPPSGAVAISRLTLYERIGPGEHPCHWCGNLVEWMVGRGVRDARALLVDHLDHDPTNDDESNLVPSCNPCNAHRRHDGTSATITPEDVTVMKGGNLTRAVEKPCEQCGAPFLAALSQVKMGKGRFCSRSCARRKPRVG